MKTNILSFLTFVACLVAGTGGDVILGDFPKTVHLGDSYTLSWTASDTYAYDLKLIRVTSEGGWHPVLDLADALRIKSLQGSYYWTVPTNLSVQDDYALWLMGMVVPYNGSGYPNQTSTFSVSHSTHKGIGGGVIAGIVIAGIVVLALIAGAFLFFTWRRRRSASNRGQAAVRANRLDLKESYPQYEMHGRSP